MSDTSQNLQWHCRPGKKEDIPHKGQGRLQEQDQAYQSRLQFHKALCNEDPRQSLREKAVSHKGAPGLKIRYVKPFFLSPGL